MVYKEANQEQSGQDVEPKEATRGALIKHHLDISLRILFSMEMLYSDYPLHLHMLSAVTADGDLDWNDWPGRMTMMGRKTAQFVAEGPVGTTVAKLEAMVGTQNLEVPVWQVEMAVSLRQMRQEIQDNMNLTQKVLSMLEKNGSALEPEPEPEPQLELEPEPQPQPQPEPEPEPAPYWVHL